MIKFPDKKYNVILCDPPWPWKNYSDRWHEEHIESKWVGKQYDLMTIEDICSLPVGDIADANSVLLMWAIPSMLPQALKVIESWGFKYKTIAFVWVKRNKIANSFFTGMGFYTRSNAEICLLAIKGKPLPRISHSVSQIVYSPVRGHSQKPPEVRDKIVELFGDLPRLEMFAREGAEGWDSWGLEAPQRIDLKGNGHIDCDCVECLPGSY